MEPYIGEIKLLPYLTSGTWMPCEGQLMQIATHQKLFAVLGTTYGGNGITNFALPDMRGRVPLHFGPSAPWGTAGGSTGSSLNFGNLPKHNHNLQGTSSPADSPLAQDHLIATITDKIFTPLLKNTTVIASGNSIGESGTGAPASNMQPYLGLAFYIAVDSPIPHGGENH